YDFAVQRLAPFVGMDRAAFDAVSLHRANQHVVLGAVLYPPDSNSVEYGVQFVGLDPYSPEEIVHWFKLVKATVYASGGAGVFYMPTFEQSVSARTNADYFAANGIPIASTERWIALNNCYPTGWELGRLQYITASATDRVCAQAILRRDQRVLRRTGAERHSILRRQGGQLRVAPTRDSHQLSSSHRVLVRFVGRFP